MGSTDFHWLRVQQQHRQQWCPAETGQCLAQPGIVISLETLLSKDFGDPMRDPCCSCRGAKGNQHIVAATWPNLFVQGLRHWGALRACRGSPVPQWFLSLCRDTSQFPFPASARSQLGVFPGVLSCLSVHNSDILPGPAQKGPWSFQQDLVECRALLRTILILAAVYHQSLFCLAPHGIANQAE